MRGDYKHARANPERPVPGWIWLSTGLSIGLLVALAVYLTSPGRATQSTAPAAAETAPADRAEPDGKPPAPVSDPQASRFDFYSVLPEREVIVPASEHPRQSRSGPARGAAGAPSQGDYMLQAGSFRRPADADRLKASLALLGVEAKIQTISVDDDTWHRVRVGPYTDLTQLNALRERLSEHEIDTLMMKVGN